MLTSRALHNVSVGVSVSESSDLARLGLIESHFRLALGEIARAVLVLGGRLVYGGHLASKGYTAFFASELRRYGRRDRPLVICLPWFVHRREFLSRLRMWQHDLGLYGQIIYLDPVGDPTDPAEGRGEDPFPEADGNVIVSSLTGLRTYMGSITNGRVVIGGKGHGYLGRMPGVLEEAIIAIETCQPLYLAGGFGGVTLRMIQVLTPAAATWLPETDTHSAEDHGCTSGFARLAEIAGRNGTPENGLDEHENWQLAATHRPSEIAALVSLGLGRLAERGNFGG